MSVPLNLTVLSQNVYIYEIHIRELTFPLLFSHLTRYGEQID